MSETQTSGKKGRPSLFGAVGKAAPPERIEPPPNQDQAPQPRTPRAATRPTRSAGQASDCWLLLVRMREAVTDARR